MLLVEDSFAGLVTSLTKHIRKGIEDLAAGSRKVPSKSNPVRRLIAFALGRKERFTVTRHLERITAYYPIVCSESISAEAMVKLPKLFENRFAAMIAVAMLDMNDLGKVSSPKDLQQLFRGGGSALRKNLDPAEIADLMSEEGVGAAELAGMLPDKEVGEILESAMRDQFVLEAVGDEKKGKGKTAYLIGQTNNATPTMLQITLLRKAGKDGDREVRIVLPVKCTLHPVPSGELLDGIANKHSGGNFLTRLIRWRTGELRFFKDLVLRRDDIREFASTRGTSRGREIVNRLFYMSREKGRMDTLTKGAFLPTTVLALSTEDAADLKSRIGVDFARASNAAKLMDMLGMISLALVDEARDVMRVYDDGRSTDHDTIGLDSDRNAALRLPGFPGGAARIVGG